MKLLGRVIGARVHYFKNVYVKNRQGVVVIDSPPKNVIGFGLQHVPNAETYKKLASQSDAGSYAPAWLEQLAKSTHNVAKTAILLEYPPMNDQILALDQVESTIAEAMDPILNHSLVRLRPLFQPQGSARGAGWVLDGCDLRYRYDLHEGVLRQGDWGLRHSIHRDLDDNVDAWNPSLLVVRNYYNYLTGLSNDQSLLDAIVNQVIALAGNTRAATRRAIFAEGARICRAACSAVPDGVRRALVTYFEGKPAAVAEETQKSNEEMYMNESIGTAVIKYGFAEQLFNLGLLGKILDPDNNLTNIVIVAGGGRLEAVANFLQGADPTLISATVWSGTAKKDLGFFYTDLPGPIEVT